MSKRYVTVTPAYGRDYKSKAAVLADWKAGKDFIIQDMEFSGYVNNADAPANWVVNVRYAKLTKVCVISD